MRTCGFCLRQVELTAPVWPNSGVQVCGSCASPYQSCTKCGAVVQLEFLHVDAGGSFCGSCCPKHTVSYTAQYGTPTWLAGMKEKWIAKGYKNAKAPVTKCLNVACGAMAVVGNACHTCERAFFKCHGCKVTTDYDPSSGAKALRIASGRDAWFCKACATGAAKCDRCGVVALLAGKCIDLRGKVHEISVCHTCMERVVTCTLCQRRVDRGYMHSVINIIFTENGDPMSAPLQACLGCLDDKTVVNCVICDHATLPAQVGFIRADGTGPKGCSMCRIVTYDACPDCTGIKKRNATRCRECQPIGAYNDRAPDKTGFLGTPKFHLDNCQLKGRDYLNPKTLKLFHAPGCNFDDLYLGVELEVESVAGDVESQAVTAKKLMQNKVICKRDGSLHNGFEVVTGPGTLDWHQQAWKPLFAWQAVEKSLASQKTTTCGLHVHVSRAPLGWLQIGKLLQFMYEPKNYAFLVFMAGRLPNRYADMFTPRRIRADVKDVKWTNGGPVTERAKFSVRRDNTPRYAALNLKNAETIEFRIFKGTLVQQTFMARLEFCHALVKFTGPAVAGLGDMLHTQFVKWVHTRSKDYPALIEYLGNGGHLVSTAAQAKPATGRT